MISITKQPPLLVLADDPVIFGVHSDNILEQQGSYSVCRMLFINVGVAGQTFTITYNNLNLVFTIVSGNPDESGAQIKTVLGMNRNNWIQYNVLPALLLNYYIARDFNAVYGIVSGYPCIILTAKEKGIAFNISQADGLNGNCQIRPTTIAVDEIARENYGVIISTSLSGNLINTDKLDFDPAGNFYTDLSEVFKAYLSSTISHPQQTSLPVIAHYEICRPFKYRYAETYGNIIRKISTELTSYALVGGMSYIHQAQLNEEGSTFFAKLQYNKQFLTWQPRVKTIFTDQPESLFYINFLGHSEITRKVKLYYTDNTDATYTLPVQTGHSYSLMQVYEFITTYNILQLAALAPTKTIRMYEFWLEIFGTIFRRGTVIKISESMFYELDRRIMPNKKTFRFRNSLGGWDTEVFTGESVTSSDIERTVYNVQLGYTFTTKNSQVAEFSALEKLSFTANTGWILSKEKADYMRQFLLSKERYEIVDGKLLPIVLTSGKIDLISDADDIYNCEIEYTRAYTDDHYSRIPSDLYARFDQSFNPSFLSVPWH